MDNKINTYEALLFDLDGTLFETGEFAIPAFIKTFERLQSQGRYSGPIPTAEAIVSTFGMVMDDLWHQLIPDAHPNVLLEAGNILVDEEVALLQSGVGNLYEGVVETLRRLKDSGKRLYVASNGGERYVKAVVHYKGLDDLISYAYTAGEFATRRKEELVARILTDIGTKRAIMVGDRQSDVVAGKTNGLPVIGCDFSGFGAVTELSNADYVIRKFTELLDVMEKLG